MDVRARLPKIEETRRGCKGPWIFGQGADSLSSTSQEGPHIQVKSEEASGRLLLETKIIKDDGYQKQQG